MINTFLIFVCILFLLLVLNQNDSSKDFIKSQTTSSMENPLENFTWIASVFMISCLLVKIKIGFD